MTTDPQTPPDASLPSLGGQRKVVIGIAVGIAVMIVAIYVRTAWHGFVHYDDDQFVWNHPVVKQGLTWDGILWALTTAEIGLWYPLTWISHMIDVELFGLDAGKHHLAGMGFHIINSVLLLVTMCYMTGRVWPSAILTMLFAVHPMQVQSVAWVSERKGMASVRSAYQDGRKGQNMGRQSDRS